MGGAGGNLGRTVLELGNAVGQAGVLGGSVALELLGKLAYLRRGAGETAGKQVGAVLETGVVLVSGQNLRLDPLKARLKVAGTRLESRNRGSELVQVGSQGGSRSQCRIGLSVEVLQVSGERPRDAGEAGYIRSKLGVGIDDVGQMTGGLVDVVEGIGRLCRNALITDELVLRSSNRPRNAVGRCFGLDCGVAGIARIGPSGTKRGNDGIQLVGSHRLARSGAGRKVVERARCGVDVVDRITRRSARGICLPRGGGRRIAGRAQRTALVVLVGEQPVDSPLSGGQVVRKARRLGLNRLGRLLDVVSGLTHAVERLNEVAGALAEVGELVGNGRDGVLGAGKGLGNTGKPVCNGRRAVDERLFRARVTEAVGELLGTGRDALCGSGAVIEAGHECTDFRAKT